MTDERNTAPIGDYYSSSENVKRLIVTLASEPSVYARRGDSKDVDGDVPVDFVG
jgi:hypothetical protein